MAKIFGNFKSGVRATFDPLGRALVRLGVSPDAVTVAGALGVVASSIFLGARGHFIIGALVITVCCLVDVLDGAMARARGYGTRFGALLDSSMDRIADGAIFGAVAYWFATTGRHTMAAISIVVLVGAQIVSYVKARAESQGFTCNVGVAERMERLILIGIGGLLTGAGVDWGLAAAVWLLAALVVITVIQRLLYVRGQEGAQSPLGLRGPQPPHEQPAGEQPSVEQSSERPAGRPDEATKEPT
jgi:CDP-diacylglycerol--glycerol-3-phosphate 3-phosphatidyltransferase